MKIPTENFAKTVFQGYTVLTEDLHVPAMAFMNGSLSLNSKREAKAIWLRP